MRYAVIPAESALFGSGSGQDVYLIVDLGTETVSRSVLAVAHSLTGANQIRDALNA